MKLVFASNNPNKIKEIQAQLPAHIQIVGLKDIGCTEDIPETANTIEGNAQLKADYVTQKYNLPCFADDTGLEVDALNGEPGVFSARYAGEQKSDHDNMNKLLQNLQNKDNRNAQFKTVIHLNLPNMQKIFTGIAKGEITETKIGDQGFGYDPIFKPENQNRTFAQMTLQEKAVISHRGKAVEQLIQFLNTL